MDLQPLYALLEKGEPAQRGGIDPKVRKKRAEVIYQAAKKVKDRVQKSILNAIASAIEDGDPRMACTMFGKLSPEGRKALPKNLAVACGESMSMRRMYALLTERTSEAGVDYAPAQDRSGKELHPGDKVSFKTYPKGTASGEVIISPRTQEKYDGKWLPALVIQSGDKTYPLISKGVRKLKEEHMRDLIQQLRESQDPKPKWSPKEVAHLPVGSIVWPWEGGQRGEQPWIVNNGGVLLPLAVLPEKSTGHFPDDGETPASVADEFILVSKGNGKLLTKSAAKKKL